MRIDPNLSELDNIYRLINSSHPEYLESIDLSSPTVITGEDLTPLDKTNINLLIFRNTKISITSNGRYFKVGDMNCKYRRIDISKQWLLLNTDFNVSYTNIVPTDKNIKEYVVGILNAVPDSITVKVATDTTGTTANVKAVSNSYLYYNEFTINLNLKRNIRDFVDSRPDTGFEYETAQDDHTGTGKLGFTYHMEDE